MDEILDIVDEHGQPTGKTTLRSEAHREGILHRTAHVWLVRMRDGKPQILLQKRSDNKDSHPGCYDISSAGHIPAGVGFVPSALRELFEELGVLALPDDLVYCGHRRIQYSANFHGKPFMDNQYSRVYYILRDVDPAALTLQKEEISEVRWMNLSDVREGVAYNHFPNCIAEEELTMLQLALES
ncbi:MAG: NUDIX domain-containing protein [Lachnospiraceae bacterium]|nr:NUDIX domain-containing protein [Lachnospiraceae bacterium]